MMPAATTKHTIEIHNAMPARTFPGIHPKSETLEYGVWKALNQRCTNPHNGQYKDYGGRGIKVCERWRNSFDNFFNDMGKRPSPRHTIERKDNGGDYTPDNCAWATRKEQNRNTRRNSIFTVGGKTSCLAELCELLDKNYVTIYFRIRRGWNVERAFSENAGPFCGTKNKHSYDQPQLAR